MRELLSRKINKNLKKYEGSLYGTTTTLYIYIYLSIYLSINIERVCCLLVLNSVTSTPQWIYIERERVNIPVFREIWLHVSLENLVSMIHPPVFPVSHGM
jgi:hypothetical protein